MDTLVAAVEVPTSNAGPRPFGLLTTADIAPLPSRFMDTVDRLRVGQGVVQTSTDFSPPHAAKTTALGRVYDEGYLFFTYHQIKDALFGSDAYEAEAAERLRRNETIAVEAVAQTRLDALDTAAVSNASVNVVLAELDEALAENYGNQGLITMHPTIAYKAQADNLLIREGGKLFTFLGTPVAVCAGFGTENVLYGSGQITVYQGSVVTALGHGQSLSTNEVIASAERVNVLMVDTYVVKGTVA